MKVSRAWLQNYFDTPLPSVAEIADAYTFHAFEIEETDGDVLDVKVLPNRAADCLSVRGLAKELSAILNIPLRHDPLRDPLSAFPKTKELTVAIDDPKKCLRYMGALVKGVQVGSSPAWLKEALESVGQRSINNVVDATNYVMLNLGQPLHAFDAGKLDDCVHEGKYGIGVQMGWNDRDFTTLSGDTVPLSDNTLIIVDDNCGTPLAIAGIKGGKAAEVSAETKNIIVESANFDGTLVRRTAQALKLFTDASLRFQNRPSPELVAYGMRDVLALIKDIAGGEVVGVVDEYPKPVKPYKTGVSASEIHSLLGRAFSEKEISDVFERLNLPFELVDPLQRILDVAQTQVGKPYKHGASVLRDSPDAFDCSSLIAWCFAQAGIGGVPRISIDQYVWSDPIEEKDLAAGDLIFFSTPTSYVWHESQEYLPGTKVPGGISHVALALGDGKMIHAHGKDEHAVVIHVIADSPRRGEIIGYRRPRGLGEKRFAVTVPFERVDLRIKEDLIEEVGRIRGYDTIPASDVGLTKPYTPDQARYRGIERMKDELVAQGFTEVSTQSFAKKGDIALANPLDKAKPFLRTTLEENLKEALAKAKLYAPLVLTPGEKPKLFEVGTVFPKTGEYMELRTTDGSVTNLSTQEIDAPDYVPVRYELGAYKSFSVYPFITRDIAFWVPEGTTADVAGAALDDVLRTSSSFNLAIKTQIWPLDKYEKDGRTSFAFRIIFQPVEKTLTDEEVNTVMDKIYAVLKNEGFEVR